MQVAESPSVVSLLLGPDQAFFYDRSGRLFAAWSDAWMVNYGLSGASVARRWKDGEREIRALSPQEAEALRLRARSVLESALHQPQSPSAAETIWRGLTFNPEKDQARYRSVYAPVGILPPDQYNACVVQVTQGCAWNQCHFCHFYRRENYRLKTLSQMEEHIHGIAGYLGDGLSLRRSIFLGAAHALAAPVELLEGVMALARQHLIPSMPMFRGFYSFIEPSATSCRTAHDFQALAQAGLKRVYYGLETGSKSLRERLGKPGALEEVQESILRAKEAGVAVSLILLAGPGGKAWEEDHVWESARFVRALPLDERDLVYLSPLYGPDGSHEVPCTVQEKRVQMARLRAVLSGPAGVAVYDIREFV